MSISSINFNNKKIKKGTSTTKIFNINDIDFNKILISKKKHLVNIIHLNT